MRARWRRMFAGARASAGAEPSSALRRRRDEPALQRELPVAAEADEDEDAEDDAEEGAAWEDSAAMAAAVLDTETTLVWTCVLDACVVGAAEVCVAEGDTAAAVELRTTSEDETAFAELDVSVAAVASPQNVMSKFT